MAELVLRDHQTSILDKLREGFAYKHRAQMMYGPCGFGKTEVACSMMAAVAEKGKRCAFVVDRRILAEQTSARLWKYGIQHGVIMAGSSQWRPEEKIQVCTAQTLEARDSFPGGLDLLMVDEAHCARESIRKFIEARPEVKVVGLSGSPFTKGLGSLYTSVATACTIDELVSKGWLIQPRVFIAKEIDMTGAKKVAGEWSQKDATERGVQITGDVVAEYLAKSQELFSGPAKAICFSAGVAHGEDLAAGFRKAGVNAVNISYRDDDEFKEATLKEFQRADSEVKVLVATDILTKGFDCADVQMGISARPFSKSFSSHVQQIGRIMRPADGKTQAAWLCHSGNYLRFREQWDDLVANGVSTLHDGRLQERVMKEPSDEIKDASKCPSCHALWQGRSDTCAHCGYRRKRRNDVQAVAGELVELHGLKKEKHSQEYKRQFYAELLGYARDNGHKPGSAYFRYKEKFGVFPSGAKPEPAAPSYETERWVRSRNIKWAKRRAA